MTVRRLWLPLVAVFAVACDSFGPTWTVDLFVPIRYPDVQLADYAVGGVIPAVDLPFTSPQDFQDLDGLIDQVISEDLVAVQAEVLFANSSAVTGSIEISVAPNPANLFTATGTQAFTVTVPVQASSGDTITATINPAMLRTATGDAVPRLYYQTRGTLRGAGGGTPVGAGDALSLGINLILTVTVNDSL